MSSTQSAWQWDAARKKYFYFAEEERCWIYVDGERIYHTDALSKATGEGREYAQSTSISRSTSGYQPRSDLHTGAVSLYPSQRRPSMSNWQPRSIIQDPERTSQPLFNTWASLHYIDPKKEEISLLVCQHLFQPEGRDCSEPWPHRHLERANDTPTHGPSLCLYHQHGWDGQTLIIDLSGVAMYTTFELTSFLREATLAYRIYMSNKMAMSDVNLLSFERMYAAELDQYAWLQFNSMRMSLAHPQELGVFYITVIVCSSGSHWTKLGNACDRCSRPLQDHLKHNHRDEDMALAAEGVAEVAGGGAGGLFVGLTVASYLLLSLLAQH